MLLSVVHDGAGLSWSPVARCSPTKELRKMQQRMGNLDNTSLERRTKYTGNVLLILTKIR